MRAVLVFWIMVFSTSAQDLQNRTLAQVALDFSPHKYIAVKSATNLKSQTSNNTNLFMGFGYRGKSWSLEVMAQKQFNSNGGFWAQDTRLVKKFGNQKKTTLYIEATPFLTQKAFGWSAYLETGLWKKFSAGGETENVDRPGPDVASLGPRISRSLGCFAGFDVSATGAFRFDPLRQPSKVTGHPHEIRFYLVFNRRIALTDRK